MREIFIKDKTLFIKKELFALTSKIKIMINEKELGIFEESNNEINLNIEKNDIIKIYLYVNDAWYYYGYLMMSPNKNITISKIGSILRKRNKKIEEILNYGN